MNGLRLGMLTPSSNTVLEPYTAALLHPVFPDISAHFARFPVTEITLGDASRSQFDTAPIVEAAALLADARIDSIAWNGTSAAWLGFARDEALCRALTERTGAPATSAMLALNRVLAATGARRLGLVTPYSDAVQEAIVANYRELGMEIAGETHSGITENYAFCEIEEAVIAAMCREVAKQGPDAIAIICTNMRGPLIAAELEAELGIPIYDSIAVTLWGALAAAEADMRPLRRWGRLFAVPAGQSPA